MLADFKKLLFSGTGKDTYIVFLGTVINVLIGGVFFIIAPRVLGPAGYGLFSTIFATSTLVVRLSSLGIDTGILRFTSLTSKESNSFLSIAIKWYLLLGALAAIAGYIISPMITASLGQPSITGLLRIAFASTVLFHLTNLFTAGLQARREFLKSSLILLANNSTRLIIILVWSYLFVINLYSLTLIFFLSTLVSAFLGKLLLPFQTVAIDKSLERKFFKFNVWIWLSMCISAIPFDNYFLLKMAGPLQTGLYAAPFKLLGFAYQLGGNFTSVLATRYSSFDKVEKAKAFSTKAIALPLFFSLGFLFIILFPNLLITLLFGKAYVEAAQVLRVLSLGSIFFFLSTIPSSIILYYFGKSNISFIITIVRYVAFAILLILLIPARQSIGAAYAFTITEVIAFILMVFYVLLKFQSRAN